MMQHVRFLGKVCIIVQNRRWSRGKTTLALLVIRGLHWEASEWLLAILHHLKSLSLLPGHENILNLDILFQAL